MFELHNLQLQLQNLKFLFSEGFANPEISIDELRKIREQIKSTEKLIEERKALLLRKESNN